MEWGVGQQLPLLCQCAPIGACIGLFFDCTSGWLRDRSCRRKLFVADVVFGGFSAIITFFGALVVLDGQLHPMLFVGVLTGFLAEHCLFGKWMGWLLFRLRVCGARAMRSAVRWSDRKILDFCSFWKRWLTNREKMRKNQNKIRKKAGFFQKST